MSKEDLKQLWLRKKNTFHYSISSLDGELNAEAGKFDFMIPPSPYPEHQGSQYALFKLNSMYVINQNSRLTTDRVSGSLDQDLSCFYVSVNGLGIQPSMGSTIQNVRIRGTNTFFIPNENALDNLTNNNQYPRISGGKTSTEYEVICSNPSGTSVSIQIFDGESGGAQINDGVEDAGEEFFTVINFSIELLDV
tara:strand:- start:454 stop:1032 length:579 start_codon:yes stop_codon:yes gene_type:complete